MSQKVATQLRHEGEPVKGSRFIATVFPVADEASAKHALLEIRAEMPDAGHHCWAWRIASPAIERASDDGEPGGSAGRPILAQLTGRDLVDTAVIVTRFWGGTKLGVGGLVRAYGGAAGQVLDLAPIEQWVAMITATLIHDHGDTDAITRVLAAHGAVDSEAEYGVHVTRTLQVPGTSKEALTAAVADATSGRADLTFDA